MKKTKSLCPHCQKPINLGSLVAHARWDGKSQKERKEIGRKLAESRVKKLSTV